MPKTRLMRLTRVIAGVGALTLAAAAPAFAAEPSTEFIGSDNMKHLKNITWPERYDSGAQSGSDLEFFTLTVGGPQAPVTPGVTPTPAATPAKKKASSKARKAYRKCIKKAKKLKKKGKGRKAKRQMKKCKKLRKKMLRAKRSIADADPKAPGEQHVFAFLGSYYNGLQIFDVNDPANPKLVNSYDCAIAQGDVQVFQRPDMGNRVFVGYGADDPYANNPESACYLEAAAKGYPIDSPSGTVFIDVTNPASPSTVSFLPFEKGSHNLTIHPSGKYLYNSNSDTLGTGDFGIEIADISDITKPKEIGLVPLDFRPGLGSESHDIWFSADGTRAYSAAVSQGVIMDTTDPAKPTVISSIVDPAVNVWHQAETMEATVPGFGERTLLIGADEFAGATGTGQCPNGGLHVYDVTGDLEAAPVKLGFFQFSDMRPTDQTQGTCTAHVFQLHREQKIMNIANYNGGVHVIDVTNLAGVSFGADGMGMVELAHGRFNDSDTWSVKSPTFDPNGTSFMFGNDMFRGFDAYQVTSSPSAQQRSVAKFFPAGQEPAVDVKPSAAQMTDWLIAKR